MIKKKLLNPKKATTLLLLIAMLMACSKSQDFVAVKQAEMAEDDMISTDAVPIHSDTHALRKATPPATQSSAAPHMGRKLIKHANIEFETKNLTEAHRRILEAVNFFNGYVARDNEDGNGETEARHIYLEVRIPSKDFSAFLARATEGVRHFDRKNIFTVDVSEEFFDIEARLKTKKELEHQFLSLLKRASSVKDILEIRRELAMVRGDIESMQGRLRYLQNQIAFSTFEIKLYQRLSHQVTFGYNFVDSIQSGWNNFIAFIFELIRFWPFIIIFTIGGFFIIKRRKNTHRKATTESQ